MKSQVVQTENMNSLQTAFARLGDRSQDIPRMGLVFGFAGAGKTTATARTAVSAGALYLRCSPVWTPSGVLDDLAKELRVNTYRRNQATLRAVVDVLDQSRRAVFLDDCDQLFVCNEPLKLFESIRYIHDQANVPLLFVGQETFESKIRRWEQPQRRISEIIEFKPLSLDDAAAIAQARCEVEVTEDLLAQLHKECDGSCGRIVVGLSAIEKLGRQQEIKRVDLDLWKQSGLRFFLQMQRLRS